MEKARTKAGKGDGAAVASGRRATRHQDEPFLGVYRHKDRPPSYYIAFVGTMRDFKGSMTLSRGSGNVSLDMELIALKRVPKAWKGELSRHFEKNKTADGLAMIGDIQYFGIDEVAMTFSYYPKHELEMRSAFGLPYFIEAVTTHDLTVQGYSHVCTTSGPDQPRVKQLERVGLQTVADVEIREWLKGMGRGIRMSVAGVK